MNMELIQPFINSLDAVISETMRCSPRIADVTMEEARVSRSLGEKGKGEEVRNDQHGGGQEIRSREVGNLRR